jgi:outer membrane protein OmpA-like peptidoglycan-associated protein
MKKVLYAIALLCALPSISSGQNILDYGNSNYSGVHSTMLNPAFIADSRLKLDVNVASFGVMAQNNYVGLKKSAFANRTGPILPPDSTTGYPAFEDSLFVQHYLVTRNNDKAKSVYFNNRVLMPLSFMITLNEKSAISLTGEWRTNLNIDGVQLPLAQLSYSAIDDSLLWNRAFTNDHLSIQFMSWMEFGVDYARVLVDDKTNFLKVGIRPKLLLGLGSMYLFADNLEYLANNNDTLTFFQSHIQYGHSTNFDFPSGNGQNPLTYNFKGVASRPGIGLDLGLVYEWRPDYQKYKYDMDGETDLWMRSKNKYKLRVGLSVTDIGSVKFDRGQLSGDFVADINQWNVHNLKFGDYPVRDFDDTLRARFPFTQSSSTYRVNLPLAFGTQVDYNIWKDFYVSMNAQYAVQWKKNPNKVHDLSYISVTPRWDWKWFGAMIPIGYNQYQNFTVGTCLRLGPLVLGTSNLAPYISKKKTIYGADFYFAIKVPILFRESRDKDKDKVSDKKDKCKDTFGVWEFMGCPDRDGDHVQDSEDVCPDEAGLKEFNGCPDRDGDGITDKQDACPDEKGLPAFNGCPDKDGDGIMDKEDDCPDEKGLPAFKGCPDRDGDGVMDKVDLCPDKPGPADNEGCPEVRLHQIDIAGTSQQSVRQAKDGSFSYNSLPVDSLCVFRLEGDPDKIIGVNSVQVMVNGSSKRATRSIADGLYRFDIPKPINVKPENPVVLTKEEQEVVKKAFENLEFESGKDVIRTSSYASLDELAELMKKHPEWALKISGHTDNVGKPASNLTLSKKRAEAVKKYLVSKGVAADHLTTEWFGQTRPIAVNTTPEGRQKNRRVEMLIIDYVKSEIPAPKPKTTPKTK